MPRRREIPKRKTLPDPKYSSTLATRFINGIMRKGKKGVAESILYGALDLIEERTKEDPLEIFEKALANVKPVVEVKSRRVGGSTYQVPVEVRHERRTALGMRWLIQHASTRGEKTMPERLAAEILEAANNRGATFKKKEDTHRMAEANKAFAHYRW